MRQWSDTGPHMERGWAYGASADAIHGTQVDLIQFLEEVQFSRSMHSTDLFGEQCRTESQTAIHLPEILTRGRLRGVGDELRVKRPDNTQYCSAEGCGSHDVNRPGQRHFLVRRLGELL